MNENKKNMIVRPIIDADSMIYASAFAEDLDSAKESLDSRITAALDFFEENYVVSSFVICSGSKGNFRKYLTDTYKANRKDIEHPQWLSELHYHAKTEWNSNRAIGVETDDLVASYFKEDIEDITNVVVSIDKDYLQFEGWIYNYNKNTLTYNTKLDALKTFYTQMIVGGSAGYKKV